MKNQRVTGTVKWFNKRKGYGFIDIDGDEGDVFLHHSEFQGGDAGGGIKEGDRMRFTVKEEEKGPAACEVEKINGKAGGTHAEVNETAGKTSNKTSKAPERNTRGKAGSKAEKKAPGRGNHEDIVKNSGTTPFGDLGLDAALLRAVKDAGYIEPTPIQAKTIPMLLEGRDMLGCAQTGTGKTAAFALPVLQHISKKPATGRKRPIRALVLTPTRELAIQVGESFSTYGKHTSLRTTVIYGGVGQQPQVDALQKGVDILSATPGRLLDLINQGYIDLGKVEYLILDEADRMLDMGFIHDVKRIMKYVPRERQTLLYSATMPKEIVDLGRKILKNPARITISPDKPAVEVIEQSVYHTSKKKKQLLLEHLLKDKKLERVLVFSRTKHGANRIVKKLVRQGINAEPIHGNKSQTARQRALGNFKDGTTRVLVATDVASRGIDVEDISHVIQFDLPDVSEVYVHRIGRTGRAGAGGCAVSFCMSSEEKQLRDIEKLLGFSIPAIKPPRGLEREAHEQ